MQTYAYCRISSWFQGFVPKNEDDMLYEDGLLYDFIPLYLNVVQLSE
jgi:hypothetical protein